MTKIRFANELEYDSIEKFNYENFSVDKKFDTEVFGWYKTSSNEQIYIAVLKEGADMALIS